MQIMWMNDIDDDVMMVVSKEPSDGSSWSAFQMDINFLLLSIVTPESYRFQQGWNEHQFPYKIAANKISEYAIG